MKPTNYSDFCLQLFGKFFRKHKKDELIERNTILEKANIAMEYEEYNAMIIMNMLIGFIATFIFSLILYGIVQIVYTILSIILLDVCPSQREGIFPAQYFFPFNILST